MRPHVLVIALTALCPALAHASGHAVARFGGEHGTVNDSNPTALYYNPGALGFSTGTQLFVDGQLALRTLSWQHSRGPGDVDPPPNLLDVNYGLATATNVFGAPMLGASFQLGHFFVGAAAYAPFGGSVSFDPNPTHINRTYPGVHDGVARWHGIEASSKSIYGTLGLAYRFRHLSVGVTGNLIYSTLDLVRAQSTDGSNDITKEGRSTLAVTGVHGSFGLGVMAEIVPERVFVALSYQAQPGLGVQRLDGTLQVTASVLRGADAFVREVTFQQALPDIWRAGVRFRVKPTLELRLAADVTRWSVQQTQCLSMKGQTCLVTASGDSAANSGVIQNVRRYWHDTVGVRGGASLWIMPTLEAYVGLGFETGATPDRTLDPVLADSANIALAFGARVELAPSWYLAGTLTFLQFMARDTTGKSQLADPNTAAVSRRPDAGGKYDQAVGILNVNVTKSY